MTCPFFSRAVVLLVEHQAGGSLGFVVNKPADVNLGEVLDQVGLSQSTTGPSDEDEGVVASPEQPIAADDSGLRPGADRDAGVMLGGPVSPHTGWVVFTHDVKGPAPEGVVHVGKRMGVSANLEMLEEIAKGEGPSEFLMTLGYASWGPGQLDDEIREGSWITLDLDAKLVFDTPSDARWRSAFERLGIDPARMTSVAVA